MSALLPLILQLKDNLVSDWAEPLDKFNISMDIHPLYKTNLAPSRKNTILAYVVLAYDNDSSWMEVHKDRMKMKIKILERLGADLKEDLYKSVLAGTHEATQRIITWFCLWQAGDYRWDQIRAFNDYHAEMMMFAGVKNATQISYETTEKDEEGKDQPVIAFEDIDLDKQIANNIRKAECLKKAAESKESAMKLLADIQREYVNTDTALHKEGVPRLTSLVDQSVWENFIHALRHDSK